MHETHALPAATRQLLEGFLDGDDNADGLDYVATHGFLTALTVGPETPALELWLPALFDNQPVAADPALAAEVTAALVAWQKEIHATLYHGQPLVLPCTLVVSTDLVLFVVLLGVGLYSLRKDDEQLLQETTGP